MSHAASLFKKRDPSTWSERKALLKQHCNAGKGDKAVEKMTKQQKVNIQD